MVQLKRSGRLETAYATRYRQEEHCYMRNAVAHHGSATGKASIASYGRVPMQATSSTICAGGPVMVVSHKAELQKLGKAAHIGAPEQFCNVPIRLIIARSLNSSRRLSCICTPAGQINSFDRLTGTAVARATVSLKACISDRFSATIYPSQSFTIEPKTHTLSVKSPPPQDLFSILLS